MSDFSNQGNQSVDEGQQQPNEDNNCKNQLTRALDLFSFLPVPRTNPVSTKKSITGTIIMIVLFLVYIIFTFVTFIISNAPKVNAYSQLMKLTNITVPDMAFAFFYGEPFSQTINDTTIFTFSMQQVYKYQNVSQNDFKIEIPLTPCRPNWFPDQGFDLMCPTIQQNMSGALYQTEVYAYSRIVVDYCDSKKTPNCINGADLARITSGGRILLFIKNNDPDFDMTTGKEIEAVPYRVFQYFLIPGVYPRAEMFFYQQLFTIFPDYFRRYKDDTRHFLSVDSVTEWITNVSIYSSQKAFQIAFRMQLQEIDSQLIYSTILDQIANWGAFWGVLFAGFAAYFLKYNESIFYEKNNQWSNFDETIGIRRLTEIKKPAQIEMTENTKFDSQNSNLQEQKKTK